ncbi:hypothetical protein OYC64_015250 [Pagothenia borchgrevinki]|uniref:Uncharacterized protein n=1 Tax=Pagothenia borchgrevinki TaxID=8213 RepID=A0ABD2HJ25_PAGBO
MPRGKSSRRSQAAKLRVAGTRVGHQQPGNTSFAPAGGTGNRHRVQKWPISSLTGRQHKMVITPSLQTRNLSSLLELHISVPSSMEL